MLAKPQINKPAEPKVYDSQFLRTDLRDDTQII